MLVSGVQENDSLIHIPVPVFFKFFPHVDNYRILSRLLCAIQYVLVGYLFYNKYSSVYTSVPNSQSIFAHFFDLDFVKLLSPESSEAFTLATGL